jgi:hypothetical protein
MAAALALAQPLWERDRHGHPDYRRPVRTPRRDVFSAQIIRLADRHDRGSRSVPENQNPPVPPEVLAAITVAANLAAAKIKEEIPDAKEAARSAVAEAFILLDIDLTKREDILRFRKVQAASISRLETQEKIVSHAWLVLTGILVLGLCSLVLMRFTPQQPTYYPPPPTTINPSTGRP